jgi:hypothetical protein
MKTASCYCYYLLAVNVCVLIDETAELYCALLTVYCFKCTTSHDRLSSQKQKLKAGMQVARISSFEYLQRPSSNSKHTKNHCQSGLRTGPRWRSLYDAPLDPRLMRVKPFLRPHALAPPSPRFSRLRRSPWLPRANFRTLAALPLEMNIC